MRCRAYAVKVTECSKTCWVPAYARARWRSRCSEHVCPVTTTATAPQGSSCICSKCPVAVAQPTAIRRRFGACPTAPAGSCSNVLRDCTSLQPCTIPHRVAKDPRFEDLSGRYNADRFRKQYAFLYEEQLPQERSSLKAAMKVGHTLGQ